MQIGWGSVQDIKNVHIKLLIKKWNFTVFVTGHTACHARMLLGAFLRLFTAYLSMQRSSHACQWRQSRELLSRCRCIVACTLCSGSTVCLLRLRSALIYHPSATEMIAAEKLFGSSL
jgi:hypothetical protein